DAQANRADGGMAVSVSNRQPVALSSRARIASALVRRMLTGSATMSGNENTENAACWIAASEALIEMALLNTGLNALRVVSAKPARSDAAAREPKFDANVQVASRVARIAPSRWIPIGSGR